MKKQKILIIGEVILDFYSNGKVVNYEQNSSAPIFISEHQYLCLGGAGNVAANVASANMNSYICSIVNSVHEKTIKGLFQNENVFTNFLLVDSEFPTSIKHRFSEKNSIIFRADEENILPIDAYRGLRESLINLVKNNLLQFDCIILSDYDKGLLDDDSIAEILRLGLQYNIPTIVDPACKTINRYRNATIIKLNKNELKYFTGNQLFSPNELLTATEYLLKKLACQAIIVTCSEEGILYLDKDGKFYYKRNQKLSTVHVIGAGDTVTAYTAYCLLHKVPMEKFLEILSVAGELAVRKPGTSHVNIDCVLKKISKEVPSDK